MVALAGLSLAGIPSIAVMGYASAVTVLVAMLGAVTLLPAFLGLAGPRIDRLHIGRRRSAAEVAAHTTLSGRWADHVGRHPWRYAIGSFVVLTAIAAPVLAMRTGMADDGTAATDKTYRKAYDLLADGFGPGFNGPLTIALEGVDGGDVDQAVAEEVRASVAATDGIVFVTEPVFNAESDTAVVTAFPATSPQEQETEALVHTLRDDVLPGSLADSGVDAYVTGQTASYIDISEKLGSRLPCFIAAVVGVSFLLLMLVFRSVLVPFKAAIMNLLSIGAAYGVVVAVFQWGWGNGLIGVEQTVPVSPFLPMIMFAILFGLSMDYEVFLLSRVREEYVPHRRRPPERRRRPGGDGAGDHVGGAHHDQRVRRLPAVAGRRGQDVRRRADGRRVRRRHASCGWSSCRRRWRSWATPTGGCRGGSTGHCRTSTSRAPL